LRKRGKPFKKARNREKTQKPIFKYEAKPLYKEGKMRTEAENT